MAQYSAQILKTIGDQIENLAPLRESFRHLQQYYQKLTKDFDQLLDYSEHQENQMINQLRYLEEVHHELQYEFGTCGEELRQMQCEHARLLMERNHQAAQCESLKSKSQLQLNEKKSLQAKRRQITEQGGKIQFNISKYKQMIHNLQLTLKSKEFENIDIQRQIKKMQLVNKKITQLNNDAQQNVESVQESNQKIVYELQDLQKKLQTYDKLIETKEKISKQNLQVLIAKTEELQQLRNRKQYIEKLIQTENNEQRQLTKASHELESLLNVKKEKLNFLKSQNGQYETQINSQKNQRYQNKEELSKLSNYLQTLVQTNEVLFRQLQKSCSKDRQVQLMLSEKLQKLIVVNDKINQNQILNRFDINKITPKNTTKDYSHSNQLFKRQLPMKVQNKSPQAKGNLNYIQERVLARQMSSTWGSLSKQNTCADF